MVVETGVGASAMGRALRWVFDNPQCVDQVIVAGFSGALQPGLSVGDLIWATEIINPDGNRWPVRGSIVSTIRNAKAGKVLTVPELVGDPERKRLLGQQFQALAVDMETEAVAHHCHEHGVPLACLRVISDDWNTALSPRLVGLLKKGQVAPLRLLGAVMRQPGLLLELLRLGRHTHFAARRLAEGLKCLLGNQ
jgi:nucleoside phosphorylase